MNPWEDAECASDAGSKESEESIAVNCVRDRILRNILMKSQAIQSENRTLREKLALYADGFKHLQKNAKMVNAVKSEKVRSQCVSNLKLVVGMGESTDLDDFLRQLKDEDVTLAGQTTVDPKEDLNCGGQSYSEPVGYCLEAFEGGKGRRRGRAGLLRIIHSLRAKLATTKDQLKEALSQISALKIESVRCRQEEATSEQQFVAHSEELEATQLRVASLEAEVIGLREVNERLKETGEQRRLRLQEVAVHVHKMHLLAQRVNSFDVDEQLAKLQKNLAGAKALLRKTTAMAVRRLPEETQGHVRYPLRCEEKCRQTNGGAIETRRSFTQGVPNQGTAGGRVKLASERYEQYGSRCLMPSCSMIQS